MRKRWVRGMLAAGILTTLTLSAALLMPRERLLHALSTRLVSMERCVATDSAIGANSEGYAWLSNNDLLLLRANPTPQGLAQVEAFRRNVHTQQETPLADFNRRQSSALVSAICYPVDRSNPYQRWGLVHARLSPDRQQLLWLSGSIGRWVWQVARLDGTPVTACKATGPRPDFAYACWLSDNRQWVTASASQPATLRFYSLDSQQLAATKILPPVQVMHPLASARDGRLLTTNQPGGDMPLLLGETRWQDKSLVHKVHNVNLTGVQIINDIAVAPDATRLALFCRLSQSAGLPPYLKQVREWLHLPDSRIWAICTCRLDGSDFREIGHLSGQEHTTLPAPGAGFTTPVVSMQDTARLPHNLQWSPDGKHLSYCESNTLYMVPVQ